MASIGVEEWWAESGVPEVPEMKIKWGRHKVYGLWFSIWVFNYSLFIKFMHNHGECADATSTATHFGHWQLHTPESDSKRDHFQPRARPSNTATPASVEHPEMPNGGKSGLELGSTRGTRTSITLHLSSKPYMKMTHGDSKMIPTWECPRLLILQHLTYWPAIQ